MTTLPIQAKVVIVSVYAFEVINQKGNSILLKVRSQH